MMCLNITYLLVLSYTYIIINSFLKTSITLYYVILHFTVCRFALEEHEELMELDPGQGAGKLLN